MIDSILRKSDSKELSKEEIAVLLSAEGHDKVKIFQKSREVRNKYFGDEIFLYGFVYFSTYCKNHCNFCYYRAQNDCPPRYRKEYDEIIETAVKLADSGVHLIDLTMGEDPYYTEHPERLAELIKGVKKATGLGIMISPGVVSEDAVSLIAESGADWYALYQETHNRELFKKLRKDQDYDIRMNCKLSAQKKGMLIEEGLLTGVGDSIDDRIYSFCEMKRINARQVRTMTFIPQSGTPMAYDSQKSFDSELFNIAVMRILFPDCLIPASLDVDGLRGLESRLMAGANVVTSIIPPQKGYAGVANSEADINDGNRTVEGIRETVEKCRLKISSSEKYLNLIERYKRENSCSRV